MAGMLARAAPSLLARAASCRGVAGWTAPSLGSCVDLATYPLLEPGGGGALTASPTPHPEQYQALVAHHRAQLASGGVTTLPGFLTEDAVAQAVHEVAARGSVGSTWPRR
jgi:hypothetical protein